MLSILLFTHLRYRLLHPLIAYGHLTQRNHFNSHSLWIPCGLPPQYSEFRGFNSLPSQSRTHSPLAFWSVGETRRDSGVRVPELNSFCFFLLVTCITVEERDRKPGTHSICCETNPFISFTASTLSTYYETITHVRSSFKHAH